MLASTTLVLALSLLTSASPSRRNFLDQGNGTISIPLHKRESSTPYSIDGVAQIGVLTRALNKAAL